MRHSQKPFGFLCLAELKSGGKANITFMGDVADCTNGTSGNQLTLNCKRPRWHDSVHDPRRWLTHRTTGKLHANVAETEVSFRVNCP